jgi:hypothetical protein
MNIAILPYDIQTEGVVEIPFATAVNESESGISGRKSTRNVPLRTYTVTINPDNAEEVQAILLANRGARWPMAMRDWAGNYKLTAEPQTYILETDTTVADLYRTYTPSTGSRTYSQRILILDPGVTLQIFVNGSPLTSGVTWSIQDPGVLVIDELLTSGDVLTVTGKYLVPVVFADDAISMTVHVDNMFSIQNLRLREILEDELTALTT